MMPSLRFPPSRLLYLATQEAHISDGESVVKSIRSHVLGASQRFTYVEVEYCNLLVGNVLCLNNEYVT